MDSKDVRHPPTFTGEPRSLSVETELHRQLVDIGHRQIKQEKNEPANAERDWRPTLLGKRRAIHLDREYDIKEFAGSPRKRVRRSDYEHDSELGSGVNVASGIPINPEWFPPHGKKFFDLGRLMYIEFKVYKKSPRFDLRKWVYSRDDPEGEKGPHHTRQGVPLTYPRMGNLHRNLDAIWAAMTKGKPRSLVQFHIGRQIYLNVVRQSDGKPYIDMRQYCPHHPQVEPTEKGVFLDREHLIELIYCVKSVYRQYPELSEVDICRHPYGNNPCEECTPTEPPPTLRVIPQFKTFFDPHVCDYMYPYNQLSQ